MKIKSMLQVGGGILIAAAGMYIFSRDIKFAQLWNEVRNTRPWVVIAVVLLSPLSLWFRALRWKVMLAERSPGNKSGLFSIVTIGFMVNNLLPARLGEAVRAVLLWKRNGYSVTESVGSLILERILDIVMFSVFFIVPVLNVKSLSSLLLYAVMLSGGLLIIVGLLLLYSRFPDRTGKIATSCINFLPEKLSCKILKLGTELVSNLKWVFSWQKTLWVVVFSFAILMCYTAMIYLLGKDIDECGIFGSMFGVAVAAIGAAIPLAPGYVGTLHAALMRGFLLLGVPVDKAGALVIMYHAIGYITVTVLGIVCFMGTKVSFSDIGKVKENLEK
jgi:uncharacterized protein (TIRG00374 family)